MAGTAAFSRPTGHRMAGEAVEMEFYPSQYSEWLERSRREEPELPQVLPRPRRRGGAARRFGIALAIFLLLAAVRYGGPRGRETLRRVLWPEKAQAVEAAALERAAGG